MKYHLHKPQVRFPSFYHPHLPHIPARFWVLTVKGIAIFGILFIVFMLFNINATSNRLAESARQEAIQYKRIAQANGRHIDCIAELWAKYTRDQKPISKPNLDKCQITEAEAAGIFSPSTVTGTVDFTDPPIFEAQEPGSTPTTTPSQNTNTTSPTTVNENPTPGRASRTPAAEPLSQTPKTPEPRPNKSINIPLCIPLTRICAR